MNDGDGNTGEVSTFADNYKVLREVSERLRRQSTSDDMPDIDQLIPDVERATAAYRACEARLQEAERALAEKLPEGSPDATEKPGNGESSGADAGSGAAGDTSSTPPIDEFDEEIPF